MSAVKLIAFDIDDLAVLAAHAQDAVGTLGDVTYLPAERRFVALVNRFDWSAVPKGPAAVGERRQAALRIEQVISAQVQGLDLKAKGQVFSILTLGFTPDADEGKAPAGAVTIVLAGGGAIRLNVDCLEIVLEDLGPVWAARATPQHAIDDDKSKP